MLNNLDKAVSGKIKDRKLNDLDFIERIIRKQDEEIDDSPIQKRAEAHKFVTNGDNFWEI